MSSQMVGSWQIDNLLIPLQFLAFAEAYLDSAARLCRVLKRSTRKCSYPRSAVVLFLTFHSVELLLKAAILQKSPKEALHHHNIEHLEKRYRTLYKAKKYYFNMPFKTEYLGFEPSEIIKQRPPTLTLDQVNRYPSNKKGEKWNGLLAFEPDSFLLVIGRLQGDFKRLKSEIFSANKLIQPNACSVG